AAGVAALGAGGPDRHAGHVAVTVVDGDVLLLDDAAAPARRAARPAHRGADPLLLRPGDRDGAARVVVDGRCGRPGARGANPGPVASGERRATVGAQRRAVGGVDRVARSAAVAGGDEPAGDREPDRAQGD